MCGLFIHVQDVTRPAICDDCDSGRKFPHPEGVTVQVGRPSEQEVA